jgi:uncharacterized protein YndB with AHSA1/START domain
MSRQFQSEAGIICWRIHLAASPPVVYQMLATDAGRARFWAESAVEQAGMIEFQFPDGQTWRGPILDRQPPHRFAVEYFGGSHTTFELNDDGAGGTDLTLTDANIPEAAKVEITAGWVSVLLALKAAVDFGVDLRNHDSRRTWNDGFADN